MDSFWKGMFAPICKHVESVRFIDFAKMDKEDWDILDYENLRPAAKVNLQKQIDQCGVTGFYKVTYDQHLGKVHGGKKYYYYPSDGDQFDGAEGDKAIDEFGNFDKFDEDADTPASFTEKYNRTNALSRPRLEELAKERGVSAARAARWPRYALVLIAIKALYCEVDATETEEEEEFNE